MSDILPGVPRRTISYNEYRHDANDADILLFEPSGCWMERFGGALIAHATDGPFDHAAAVKWIVGDNHEVGIDDRPWVSEYTIPVPHLVPLSAKVRQYSGKVSVFRYRGLDPKDEEPRSEKIGAELMKTLGGQYRYGNLGLIALTRLALIRWLFWFVPALRRWRDRWIARESRKRTYGICSQHVSRAYKFGAGIELVRKPLAEISPNDIARCPQLEYLFTLTWPNDWAVG